MSIYRKYNIDFEKIKPFLLDGFVAVYGEKNRKLLSERINEIYVNGYYTYEELRLYVDTQIKLKKGELTARLLEENGFKLPDEQKNSVLKKNDTYGLGKQEKTFLKICFGHDSGYSDKRYGGIVNAFDEEIYQEADSIQKGRIDQQRVEILNVLGAHVTTENLQEIMQSGALDKILEKIERLKSDIKSLDTEYQGFISQYDEEQHEIEKDETIDREILKKYNLKYLEGIKNLLPPEEQEEIASMVKQGNYYYTKDKIFMQRNIKLESMIESFSTSAEGILTKGKEFQKRDVLRNRILYFNQLGYDFGEDYETYMNHSEIKQIIPSSELADQIKQIRERCNKEYIEEKIRETSSYKDNQENLGRLGLIAQIDFSTEFFENNIICTIPNAVQGKDGLEERAIINIPIFNLMNNHEDVLLVHEIGHAMELELLEKDEKHLRFKTGFDYVKADLREEAQSPDTDNNDRRDMELMSEIIHHQLAMEVTRNLHEKGIYLIGDSHTEQIRGATSYEQYFNILHPFYEKYREQIIEARLTEKGFQQFMGNIPKEKFQQLNEIVKEYCQVPYLSVKSAIYEGRTTPETEKWSSLMKKMKELMQHFTERPTNTLLTDILEETKQRTRMGEIRDELREIQGKIRGEKEQTNQRNGEERQ